MSLSVVLTVKSEVQLQEKPSRYIPNKQLYHHLLFINHGCAILASNSILLDFTDTCLTSSWNSPSAILHYGTNDFDAAYQIGGITRGTVMYCHS